MIRFAALFVGGSASAAMLMGSVGSSTRSTTYTVAPVAVSALTLALQLPEGCDVDCYQPWTCQGTHGLCSHKAPEQNPGTGSHTSFGEPHPYCWEGACHEGNLQEGCYPKHATCQPTNLDGILQTLTDGNYVLVAAMMDLGSTVRLDRGERLIAFRDCAGRTAATIALAGDELYALEIAQLH